MKMRARKRYHDSWQVGRELFRLNQRISASWKREIKAYPVDNARHDDLMDAMQYVQGQINSTMGIPASQIGVGPRLRVYDRVWIDEAPTKAETARVVPALRRTRFYAYKAPLVLKSPY